MLVETKGHSSHPRCQRALLNRLSASAQSLPSLTSVYVLQEALFLCPAVTLASLRAGACSYPGMATAQCDPEDDNSTSPHTPGLHSVLGEAHPLPPHNAAAPLARPSLPYSGKIKDVRPMCSSDMWSFDVFGGVPPTGGRCGCMCAVIMLPF